MSKSAHSLSGQSRGKRTLSVVFAVISVVYTATRYEDLTRIVKQSIRLFGVIMGVLALATAFLLVVNSLI